MTAHSPSPHHWAKRHYDTDDWANMRNNGICAGLDGVTNVNGSLGEFSKQYKKHLITLWEIVTNVFIEDQDFVDKVYHVGIGNPPFIQYGGYKLTHSDITNLFNAWRISRYVDNPKHIIEIGGGFGCLAAMLKWIYPRAKITLVDLKDSLAIQRYYLKESFGTLSDFSFKQDMEDIEGDLVINIRSMMEMTPEQIAYYFLKIQHSNIEWFYCVNRYSKHMTKLREYPFDDNWIPYVSQSLPGQDHIHEYLLRRGDGRFTNQLKTLRL